MRVLKIAVKYIIIAFIGVILFALTHRAALHERPAGGIGGEAVFLGLPLMWWIVKRAVKDFIADFKREWVEIKAEMTAESGSDDFAEKAKK